MIKVKAHIKLYNKGRKTPFFSKYRPLFSFVEEMLTSGSIELIDRDEFYPGDEGDVIISFLYREFLGEDFGVNKRFTFGEGTSILGEGFVKEIL